jgi:hypothetical protein
MKLNHGEDIRWTDRYRHKYGSAMAEYLCTVEGGSIVADEDTGTVEAPTGWVGRFGRRLMTEDDRGFITVERFATEDEAIERFEAIAEQFNAWDLQDEDEAIEGATQWQEDEADEADASGIRCHDGAGVDLSLGVPACLQATPFPGSRFNDWVTAHNRALDDYVNNRARRNETAVLALLDGILSYCGSHDAMGTGEDIDGYGAEHVLAPLLDGFDNALNFDLGRLDGGTLSGVSHAIRSAYAGGIGA